MAEGFKKVPVMAWGFQNLFFGGCQPKKKCASYGMGFSFFLWESTKKETRCQLWHVHFKTLFFWGVPTQKIGASYGIEISKPYYYLVVFPKNGASYGMEPALFLFEGLPKKSCYFWHGIFPKKCASYGMLLPLIYFHLVVTPKKSVPVMAWKPIPLYLFRGGPIHLFIFGVLPTTATTKNTPAHSSLFFQKNHSCSCSSSWSKKNAISGRLSLCRLVCCEEPSQAMSLQLQLHLLPHQGQGAHQGLVLL